MERECDKMKAESQNSQKRRGAPFQRRQRMSQLSNIKNVKEILARHGFTFSKKLGQNFIVNPSICPRIAELGGAGPDTGVLEIGPGL